MHWAPKAPVPERAIKAGRYSPGGLSLIWRLVLPPMKVRFANVIGLAGGVTVGLEYGLREDVVKLKAVLRATVTQSNSKVGMPVACTSSVERQEHSLEKGTALISTFQLSGRDIEATHL
jgi:hypothetical protein